MRSVVVYTLLSADGIAERPDRFVLEFDDRMRANLAQVVAAQDAVLLGRHSYDDWARYWPQSQEEPFAPFINGVEKYVVTSARPSASWARTTVVTEPVADLLARLRQVPGGDIGVHGSITLVQRLLGAGLVDELRLVVAPTLAGEGRHLFAPGERRRLELLEAEQTPSGALLLHYRVGAQP